MSAGHTPGPWDCDKQYPLILINGEGSSLGEMTPGDPFITFEEAVANARLAATSLEMLEALDYYADQLCEGWCEQSPDCAHFEDCAGCLARRVVYKATGAA